jgi:hypothetical protein
MGRWQIRNDELWNEAHQDEPGRSKFRRLVRPVMPAGPGPSCEEPTGYGNEQDQIS